MHALHTSLSKCHRPGKYLLYDYFCLMTLYCRHSALIGECHYYCPSCSIVMCVPCILTHVICQLPDTIIPYCAFCKKPLPTKVLARLSLTLSVQRSVDYEHSRLPLGVDSITSHDIVKPRAN